jgi:PAS domain S-box-containing protein
METKKVRTMDFIKGGGEMGSLIRSKDWSQTSIGAPGGWPSTLKNFLPTMLNCAFPMFLWWGKELVCFYNDAYRPSLGIEGKHPSILGQPAREAWPEIWDIICPLIKQVLETGKPTWSENQLIPIYRNGQLEDVYWTFSYGPLYGDEGEIEGVVVTCSETTSTVINLKRLEESKEQLHFAIEASEMGTWDFNPETNTFSGNNRIKEWFGVPLKDDIDLQDALLAIAETDRQRVVNSIDTALQHEKGGKYDVTYAIRNLETGRSRVVRAMGRAWFNEDKVATRFNGVLQDITQQFEIEKEKLKLITLLQTSERQFKSIVMSSPISMAIFRGRDHTIEIANEMMMMKIWRKKRKDVIGKPLLEVFPELKDQKYPELLDQVFREDRHITEKESLAIVAGDDGLREFYVDYDYAPLHDVEGTVTGIMITVNDVTERVHARERMLRFSKKLEEEVKERTEMLQLANVRLQDSVNELEEANAELKSFAYVSSHDLQEPLRKIQIFSSRIIERSGEHFTPKDRADFDRIAYSTKRMRKLIDDLLAFSQISYSEDDFKETDLNVLLEGVKEDLDELLKEEEVSLTSDILPTLEVIPFQISQMMTNLIENSVKFQKERESPVISIRSGTINASEQPGLPLRKGSDYYYLEFTDNGIGFEPRYKDRIFEVFQRLHNKGKYSGTGIGLAIVKKIVNNHDGIITVWSNLGQGASFRILLPQSGS